MRQPILSLEPLHMENRIKVGAERATKKTEIKPQINVYRTGTVYECDIILPDTAKYGAMRCNQKDIYRYAYKQQHVLFKKKPELGRIPVKTIS